MWMNYIILDIVPTREASGVTAVRPTSPFKSYFLSAISQVINEVYLVIERNPTDILQSSTRKTFRLQWVTLINNSSYEAA